MANWHNFLSWMQGGFHIGFDIGKGIAFALPQGVIDPFADWANYKNYTTVEYGLRQFVNIFKFIGDWLTGPLFGLIFSGLSMIPGSFSVIILKRGLTLKTTNWMVNLARDHSPKVIWSAFAMSGLWLLLLTLGTISMPSITLFGLTLSPVICALTIPLLTNVSMMMLAGVGHGVLTLCLPILLGRRTTHWAYSLKGVVDYRLRKRTEIKALVHHEFESELDIASDLYEQRFSALTDELERVPTNLELRRNHVLTYYDLLNDQRNFLREITVSHLDEDDQKQAIAQRHQRFRANFGMPA